MKFFSLCAEAYIDTPSRGWKKHKIGDNTPIFYFLFCFDEMGVNFFDDDKNTIANCIFFNKCGFSHFVDTL